LSLNGFLTQFFVIYRFVEIPESILKNGIVGLRDIFADRKFSSAGLEKFCFCKIHRSIGSCVLYVAAFAHETTPCSAATRYP
jgi:hypothetical protein